MDYTKKRFAYNNKLKEEILEERRQRKLLKREALSQESKDREAAAKKATED